jgi:hypothetical protein
MPLGGWHFGHGGVVLSCRPQLSVRNDSPVRPGFQFHSFLLPSQCRTSRGLFHAFELGWPWSGPCPRLIYLLPLGGCRDAVLPAIRVKVASDTSQRARGCMAKSLKPKPWKYPGPLAQRTKHSRPFLLVFRIIWACHKRLNRPCCH